MTIEHSDSRLIPTDVPGGGLGGAPPLSDTDTVTTPAEPRIPDGAVPPATDLDRALVLGVAWTSGIKWVVQVLTWGSTLLVMRLLTPEDYGVVGMAALFLGLVAVVSEFGLGSAVVALRRLKPQQIAQLNGLAIAMGVGATLVTIAVAEPIARFFDSSRLPAVVAVLSLTFLMSAFGTVPKGTLKRDLRYRTLALVEGAQAIGAVVVTLLLAWLGFGYWALVLGRLAEFGVGAAALLAIAPHHFARPRVSEIRETLTFSAHIITSSTAWYAYSNADYLIVGKMLGETALGLYTAAFTLARMPAEKITTMVMRVTPGIFSAVQEDSAALRRYLLLLTSGLSMIAFPPILGLGLVAPELIPLALGDQWREAVVPLQVLSVGATLYGVVPLFHQVLTVTQETRYAMRVSVVASVIFIPSFYFASQWGAAGIAVTWVVLDPLVVGLPNLLRVRRRIGLSLRSYAAALGPAITASVAMAVAVIGLRGLLHDSVDGWALLLAEVVIGAVVYVLTLALGFRSQVQRMLRAIHILRGS